MRLFQYLGALAIVVASTLAAHAAPFTFAGFTFEQSNTPDQIALIGNSANLGGIQFSSGLPDTITQSVGFGATGGSSGAGFTPAPGWTNGLSLGQQANAQLGVQQSGGGGSLFSSAVNLPNNNNGSTIRHGLSASWSSGVGVANGVGNDFVIYESGSSSSSGSIEGYMVRVGLADGSFSDWFWSPTDSFQVYANTPATAEGAFATAFDLSDFGLAPGQIAISIQIANLVDADRITSSAGGFVNINGASFDPGFGSSTLDPDPLYVGILGNLASPQAAPVPEPASLAVWSLIAAVGAGYGFRRRKQTPVLDA